MDLQARRFSWLLPILGLVLIVAAYAPALRAGFVWDDDDHVTRNETLVDLDGLRRIWTEPGAVPQYYPLVHTTFWVERHLWGLDPAPYHGLNILLHGLASFLLWRLLVRLEVRAASLAALLFAVHPVGVESVAWITERKNLLSAVFSLGSALAWLRIQSFPAGGQAATPHAAPGGRTRLTADRRWYFLSLALFIAAMLSKTVAASLPAAMLVVCWWKRGTVTRSDVRPLVPFFAIGLILALNTAWMERSRVGAVGPDWEFSGAERLLIAGRALWFYATKLLWPSNLTFIYPRWEIDAGQPLQWVFPLAAVAILALAWLARRRFGRGPFAALLFFGGTLVPALGFINVYPMRFSFVADHFQYFASIGILVLVATALSRLASRWAFALVVPLAVLTWNQAHVYKDLETLWSDTLEKNPAAWLAHNNLANVRLERGETESAIVGYRQAVLLKPDYYEALANLGAALLQRGAIDEARMHTEAALRIAPTFVPARVNRAALSLRDGRLADAMGDLEPVMSQDPGNPDALNVLGSAYALGGDVPKAEAAFRAALRGKPDLVPARVNLARVLLRSGRVESAALELDQAIRGAPGNSEALNLRGQLLVAQGRPADAIAYYEDLSRRLPDDASARFNLGTLLSQSGRVEAAIPAFEAALRLNPAHAEARNNLGIGLLILGRYAEAAQQFTAALEVRQRNPEAHNNLAFALIRLGRPREARRHLEEALRLRPDYAEARAQLRQLGPAR